MLLSLFLAFGVLFGAERADGCRQRFSAGGNTHLQDQIGGQIFEEVDLGSLVFIGLCFEQPGLGRPGAWWAHTCERKPVTWEDRAGQAGEGRMEMQDHLLCCLDGEIPLSAAGSYGNPKG